MKAYNLSRTGMKCRLQFSRRLAGHGKGSNEGEISAFLLHYGFETFAREDLPLREQVALSAKGEIVIARQGSGLTSLLFPQDGTRMLDMHEPSKARLAYLSKSKALDPQHGYFFANAIPLEQSKRPDRRVLE
jgi:capsular polysaccharide biosynthesis protein